MWTAITASALLLAILLGRGRGPDAWIVAGAAVALSCAAMCIWFAVMAARSARAQERSVDQLAEVRRTSELSRTEHGRGR